VGLAQVVHVEMMIDLLVVVMTVQVRVVPVEMMIVLPVVVMIVPPAVAMSVQVQVVQVLLGQVQVDQVQAVHSVIVMTGQVQVVQVETMIVPPVVVMTDRVQAVQVRIDQVRADRVLDDRFVIVMIVPHVVVMTGQVQAVQVRAVQVRAVQVRAVQVQVVHSVIVMIVVLVDRAQAVRFAVGMIGRVVVGMIAVMFLRVRRRQRNAKPMKFITAPVGASMARSQCRSPNTQLSGGAMMVQLVVDRVVMRPVKREAHVVRQHEQWLMWKPPLPRQLQPPLAPMMRSEQ
jgi:hypothetical protein